MPLRDDAPRDLLFGLLALQTGLVTRDQLVLAFTAWTGSPGRPLADLLAEQGVLRPEHRPILDGLAEAHLKLHGGDPEKSLAALELNRSTRESLARAGGPGVEATMAHVGSGSGANGSADQTASYAVGTATSDGQRFRVLRPHARGGLGAVFVALDGELHREVALKQILDQYADDEVSRVRFMLEAEITGGLEHPGIVPVYGLGSYDDGRPFYAMRFIRGDSLKEAIEDFHSAAGPKRGGTRTLELKKLLRRFLDVCNALQYAHDRGVLHRDVKPGNVIVGRYGETLVIDWGLAKPMGRAEPGADGVDRPLVPASASGSAETLPGSTLGTPAYMSPEQAAGDLDNLGPRSDVYSLGATLYCILVGRPPFVGDVGEVLQAVQKGKFAPPRALDASVDRAIEAVCLTAMARKPEDRYANCRALADDVERYIADEPVSVYRESFAVRATRWGRRHRTAATSVGVLLLTAVVGLSIGTVLINRERARAEENFRLARAAVDRYFTTVSESHLLAVPGLQPLRKELLDAAQEYYQGFLRDHADDPAVRADAAAASFRVGWIDVTLGRMAESLAPLKASERLYEQATRDRPADFDLRRGLSMAQGAIGLAETQLGHHEEALAAHRRALAVREALARERPDDPVIRADTARTRHNIGAVLQNLGKFEETLAEWDAALETLKSLAKGPLPSGGRAELTGRRGLSMIVRDDLATLYLDRASMLRDRAHLAEAEEALRAGSEILDGLVKEAPDDFRLRASRGWAFIEEGKVLTSVGKREEAANAYRTAVGVFAALAAENPSVPDYRFSLADARESLVRVCLLLGRTDEARDALSLAVEAAERLARDRPQRLKEKLLLLRVLNQSVRLQLNAGDADAAIPPARRAVDLAEDVLRRQPNDIRSMSNLSYAHRALGRCEAKAGHPAGAVRAFERAAELSLSLADRFPSERYNQACALALMCPLVDPARRETLGDQAVAEIRAALAAGYNRHFLRDDHDLDALRDTAAFKLLMMDLAMPADPFRGAR